ncbi:uncharacterized protein B0P05DRAFT_579662 [Gilbertella persicaria]|uniref:uncharacterized protein n=1 Tax=Gilbertella persicaria TaxID=101096 RepID=UPI00221F0456|nr:uncharacterized protein B0P05DRAFT_579662 [Gilbertella persicaria]KAI8077294.1 hypothetical protein B0P05DRAFT_579662 [Gilbertella persicaria]
MTGATIPSQLPPEVKNEIRHAVAIVQGNQPTSLVPLQSSTSISNQPTGIPSQPTSIPVQPTSISIQPTGISIQPTGYNGPMMTAPMPTGMLNNNMDFANRMMPHTTNYTPPSGFESLSKNVKIPWAVTAEEKKQYAKIFKAWDIDKKGTISGEKAKDIFSQSGLPQNVLMQIWNLADPNNQGKLNVDEFSVAMHLIYRKLNGYNVPETLPPELVPPSTRDLAESVDLLKKTILDDIAKKRHIANFRSSPSLPTSPPTRSVSSSPSLRSTKNKEEDKDTEVGYVSSARRMGPDRNRVRDMSSSSPNLTSYGYRGKQTRIFDLRKDIEACKKQIEQYEQEAIHPVATPYSQLSALDKKDIDGLKDRIRELQQEISKTGSEQGYDAWNTYISKTAELAHLAEQEKSLETEIEYMLNVTLKGLLAQVDETEDDLREKKVQAAQAKASSTDVPLDIVGTGPHGEVTESDRIKAKAKAMVAARMGKLTGKSTTHVKADIDKIDQERQEFKLYTNSIADLLQELQDAVKAIQLEMSMIGLDIRKHDEDQKKIEERGRFEHGENVAKDLKEFIQELSYHAELAKAPDVDPSFESRFPSF